MFVHRLALALGRTVAELYETLTPQEMTEWQAYYQLEPWGAWRDNWHSAQLSTLLFNINRGKHPAAKVKDFMYEDAEVTAANQAKTFVAALKARAKT